jgi:hypothetical protein
MLWGCKCFAEFAAFFNAMDDATFSNFYAIEYAGCLQKLLRYLMQLNLLHFQNFSAIQFIAILNYAAIEFAAFLA